jgi:hypothetical protein
MKKIGEYTMRGQSDLTDTASPARPIRVTLFDGSFTTAYRLVEFIVSPRDAGSSSDVAGKVSTDDPGTDTEALGSRWNWQRNTEIGWASTNAATTSIREKSFSLVDPDNLIVEDCFLSLTNNAGDGSRVNYFMRFEKYEVSDWRGALAMVRSKSQNV